MKKNIARFPKEFQWVLENQKTISIPKLKRLLEDTAFNNQAKVRNLHQIIKRKDKQIEGLKYEIENLKRGMANVKRNRKNREASMRKMQTRSWRVD